MKIDFAKLERTLKRRHIVLVLSSESQLYVHLELSVLPHRYSAPIPRYYAIARYIYRVQPVDVNIV